MAVKRLEVIVQTTEVQDLVNAAQQVITWEVTVEVEGIEEPVLCATSSTHHRDALPLFGCDQLRSCSQTQGVFQQNRPEPALGE